LWWRILWGIGHVQSAQDQVLAWTLLAYSTRWALFFYQLGIVAMLVTGVARAEAFSVLQRTSWATLAVVRFVHAGFRVDWMRFWVVLVA